MVPDCQPLPMQSPLHTATGCTSYDPDGDTNDILTTGGPNNFSGTSDKTLDSLVQQAATATASGERRRLYAEVVHHVATRRPLIYLCHDRWFTGTSRDVHGVQYFPDGIPRFKTAYMSH